MYRMMEREREGRKKECMNVRERGKVGGRKGDKQMSV